MYICLVMDKLYSMIICNVVGIYNCFTHFLMFRKTLTPVFWRAHGFSVSIFVLKVAAKHRVAPFACLMFNGRDL